MSPPAGGFPYRQSWPWSATIIDTDSGERIPMLIVRGCDNLPLINATDGSQSIPVGRVFHLFGPPHRPLPDHFRPHVEPVPDDSFLRFEVYRDPHGVARFAPAYSLAHTLN